MIEIQHLSITHGHFHSRTVSSSPRSYPYEVTLSILVMDLREESIGNIAEDLMKQICDMLGHENG